MEHLVLTVLLTPHLAIHVKGGMWTAALEWARAEDGGPESRAFHFIG